MYGHARAETRLPGCNSQLSPSLFTEDDAPVLKRRCAPRSCYYHAHQVLATTTVTTLSSSGPTEVHFPLSAPHSLAPMETACASSVGYFDPGLTSSSSSITFNPHPPRGIASGLAPVPRSQQPLIEPSTTAPALNYAAASQQMTAATQPTRISSTNSVRSISSSSSSSIGYIAPLPGCTAAGYCWTSDQYPHHAAGDLFMTGGETLFHCGCVWSQPPTQRQQQQRQQQQQEQWLTLLMHPYTGNGLNDAEQQQSQGPCSPLQQFLEQQQPRAPAQQQQHQHQQRPLLQICTDHLASGLITSYSHCHRPPSEANPHPTLPGPPATYLAAARQSPLAAAATYSTPSCAAAAKRKPQEWHPGCPREPHHHHLHTCLIRNAQLQNPEHKQHRQRHQQQWSLLQQQAHPQLALQPLNCQIVVLATSSGAAAEPSPCHRQHRQQRQPQQPPPAAALPMQPPSPHQQKLHRQQRTRPCCPYFAPVTPPLLDEDAPSECILLLCKALCMSEGTTGRLALHIWNRIRETVRLLVSVRPQAHGHNQRSAAVPLPAASEPVAAAALAAASAVVSAAAADRVYSVAAVWLAAKLEESRRMVPGVQTLAAAACTLPSVLIVAELRVLQWCEWSPYSGFVPDESHLLFDL